MPTSGPPTLDMDTLASADAPELPELIVSEYIRQVLQLPDLEAQESFEADLFSKAASWDIPLPNPVFVFPPDEQKRNTGTESQVSTVATSYTRTFSSVSCGSASTALTSPSATEDLHDAEVLRGSSSSSKPSRTPSFTHYDKYLAQVESNPGQHKPKYPESQTPRSPVDSVQSLFSVSSRKNYFGIMNGMRKIRWGKRHSFELNRPIACVRCQENFTKTSGQHALPCGHSYCTECLRLLVRQATMDESKFPPQCCTQPITSSTLKAALSREDSRDFLRAVQQFSTPWESRVFCPNAACGEFIPRRGHGKTEPQPPRDVVCSECGTGVCVTCKSHSHAFGQECPEDWELGRVPKAEKPRWMRCQKCKCRALVELGHDCTHTTCRCEAQLCYACGVVWKPSTGRPGMCHGTGELERRRVEEEEQGEARHAPFEVAERARGTANVEIDPVEKWLREPGEFTRLRRDLEDQRRRFRAFMDRKKAEMGERHEEERRKVTAKYADQAEKMRERHDKTATQLEERQIEAEMEMRATLEQEQKSVLIRLRHMEAYCDGLGHSPESGLPPRAVTERDLRELGQQYNLRDGMARLHESKINVLREKQAKRMGDLVARQEEEVDKFEADRDRALEALAATVALEEDELARVFRRRELEVRRLWQVRFDILRKELERRHGVAYGAFDVAAAWLEGDEADDASSLPWTGSADASWQPSTEWLSLL
ncbi:hypothetical protein ACRALDRAFT_1074716 [Sodiomyces alcalophilus JCM 7366]|uniref:uncharacterized protein n=1 Tax=Sodiomyces alcalophilus JCM 7366 TaxID=591952 RepID=UPI0039B41B88